MSSSRPYLIRAIYDWVVDNGCTPHMLVNCHVEGVDVPAQFIKGDKIVLNVSPEATHGLQLGNDWISFSARFGGMPTQVNVPPGAVMTIYARETGQGMVFSDEDSEPAPPEPDPPKSTKPSLKVVK